MRRGQLARLGLDGQRRRLFIPCLLGPAASRRPTSDFAQPIVDSPYCVIRNSWPVGLPRDGIDEIYQMVDPLVEHVQRMHIEERRGLPLDCLSLVIELEVALAEIHVCLILMPSEHELALRLNH